MVGGLYGSFRKLGVPYFGVLIIRILLYQDPLFLETPILKSELSVEGLRSFPSLLILFVLR